MADSFRTHRLRTSNCVAYFISMTVGLTTCPSPGSFEKVLRYSASSAPAVAETWYTSSGHPETRHIYIRHRGRAATVLHEHTDRQKERL